MSKKTFYNQATILKLEEKYNVGSRFIIMSINKERTSARAMDIRKDYLRIDRYLKNKIKSL